MPLLPSQVILERAPPTTWAEVTDLFRAIRPSASCDTISFMCTGAAFGVKNIVNHAACPPPWANLSELLANELYYAVADVSLIIKLASFSALRCPTIDLLPPSMDKRPAPTPPREIRTLSCDPLLMCGTFAIAAAMACTSEEELGIINRQAYLNSQLRRDCHPGPMDLSSLRSFLAQQGVGLLLLREIDFPVASRLVGVFIPSGDGLFASTKWCLAREIRHASGQSETRHVEAVLVEERFVPQQVSSGLLSGVYDIASVGRLKRSLAARTVCCSFDSIMAVATSLGIGDFYDHDTLAMPPRWRCAGDDDACWKYSYDKRSQTCHTSYRGRSYYLGRFVNVNEAGEVAQAFHHQLETPADDGQERDAEAEAASLVVSARTRLSRVQEWPLCRSAPPTHASPTPAPIPSRTATAPPPARPPARRDRNDELPQCGEGRHQKGKKRTPDLRARSAR